MRTRTALLGITALLTLAGSALADNRLRPIDDDTALYRATFDGGHLGEFIDMLRDGMDGKVVFITPERAEEITLPKFDIANVEFGDVLALVPQITGVGVRTVEMEAWSSAFSEENGAPVVVFDVNTVLPMRSAAQRIEEVRYAGGSVEGYVEALKRAGAEGRVAITGDAGAVPLGPIALRDVSLEAAVELLDGIELRRDGMLYSVDIERLDGLYRVHVSESTRNAASVSRVWSLRSITANGMDTDTLLGAIEAGLGTLGEGEQPTLKFHEPTALLIANGRDGALGLIEAIIDGLEVSAVVGSRSITGEERMLQYVGLLQRHIERETRRLEGLLAGAEEREARVDALSRQIDTLDQNDPSQVGEIMITSSERGIAQEEANSLRARAEDLRFEIDGHRTRLAQLERLMKLVEDGFAPTPTESLLNQEFGIDPSPGVR